MTEGREKGETARKGEREERERDKSKRKVISRLLERSCNTKTWSNGK